MSNTGKEGFYSRGYYRGFSPEPRFRKVVNIFSKIRGEKLLDIGCGTGDFTVLIAAAMQAKEVWGIDIAPEAVAAAKSKGVNAVTLDVDINRLPFADSFFDAVYCGELIEHLFDPDHLLNEIYRVLRSKGICVISTPNLAGWANRLALLLGYQPYATAVSPEHEGLGKFLMKGPEGQWGHIRVFTLRAFKELIKLHGFKLMRLEGVPVTVASATSPLLSFPVKTIDRLMAKIPCMANRIIAEVEVVK